MQNWFAASDDFFLSDIRSYIYQRLTNVYFSQVKLQNDNKYPTLIKIYHYNVRSKYLEYDQPNS